MKLLSLLLLFLHGLTASVIGQGFVSTGLALPSGDARQVELADADLDGDVDLIMFGETSFSVIPNLGGFTFGPRVSWPLSLAFARGSAARDLDGDGDADAACVWFDTSGVLEFSVSLNDGIGNFALPTHQSISTNATTGGVEYGDFTGDQIPDVFIASSSSEVTVFVNTGSGTFFAGPTTSVPANLGEPASGDLDGDGDRDVVLSYGSQVRVLFNNGVGAFSLGSQIGVTGDPRATALADLDGDLDLDLVTARYLGSSPPPSMRGQVRTWLNNGNGTFSPLYTVTMARADGLAVADLDADGLAEVAVSQNATDRLAIIDGVTQSVTQIVATGDTPRMVLAGDIDGDGRPDLSAPCSFSHETFVFRNLSTASPMPVPYPGTGEDLLLLTGVDATPTAGPGNSVKSAGPGSVVQIEVRSPGGLFDLEPYLLLADVFPTGMPPSTPPGLPWLHLSVPGFFVLVDGTAPAPFAPVIFPSGSVLPFVTPPGLAGQSAIFQSAAISTMAANGVFAVSDAHELQFVP